MHSSPTPRGIGRSHSKLRLFLSCSVAAFVIAAYSPSGAAAQSKSDALDAAEEVGEWLKDIVDEYSELKEQSRKLSDLRAKIKDARENPSALTGENYAQLFVEITMMIPEAAGLPSSVKQAVKVLALAVAPFISRATDFGLAVARRNFKNQLDLLAGDTSMSESDKAWTAAKRAGSTRQVQLRLLLDWSLAKVRVNA